MNDKKTEDLKGKVLDPKDLLVYRDGSVVSRMLVYKPEGDHHDLCV